MAEQHNEFLGKCLKQALKSHGITQRELAAKLDITPSAVSQFVKGKMTPSSDICSQIMKIVPDSTHLRKFLSMWKISRLGAVEEPAPQWGFPEDTDKTNIGDTSENVFLLTPEVLQRCYDPEYPLSALVYREGCTTLKTALKMARYAEAATIMRCAELKLDFPGDIMLLVTDKDRKEFHGVELVCCENGFILNPGSGQPVPEKIKWKLSVLAMVLQPVPLMY